MSDFDLLRELAEPSDSKIVLLVMDGLGGLPRPEGGGTELEEARKPNLDALAARSTLGLSDPIGPGISPGSGPGHLALFGYDPLKYLIGRGVLEAVGIGFDLLAGDVAARGNFCTVDEQGLVTDRRAGRIATETNIELCGLLRKINLPGVQLFVEPVKEHRFVLVLRGPGLAADLSETDPQRVGLAPLDVKALAPRAQPTADLINRFIVEARKTLAGHHPANMVLLRGFAEEPGLPKIQEVYKLRPAAIATYPMYRGVAKLAGMDVLPTGETIADEFATLRQNWERYDFFFVHVKKTDSAGEDGDFARKMSVIEEVDRHIPEVLDLKPTVFIVTADHSTPTTLRSHSWHPVPVLLYSPNCRPDGVASFSERTCRQGGLGHFPAKDLMSLALGHALRLKRYGA
jgi:2,3-bisphosphoglycerate-independent phosphoglycerate mutase